MFLTLIHERVKLEKRNVMEDYFSFNLDLIEEFNHLKGKYKVTKI